MRDLHEGRRSRAPEAPAGGGEARRSALVRPGTAVVAIALFQEPLRPERGLAQLAQTASGQPADAKSSTIRQGAVGRSPNQLRSQGLDLLL